MSTKLIYFTGKGTSDEQYYAARILAFTKSTRLQMTPDGLDKFISMPIEDLLKEMEYMSSSIASSWEFIDVIFSVNGISRACAQQMTRTRTASYAMQSQRVTNMKDISCHVPDDIKNRTHYQLMLSAALVNYQTLVDDGESLENARGVLPMNTHCNLIAKYNFRAWIDLIRARDSLRVQGEYFTIVQEMKQEVLKVWPWALTFIEAKQKKAIDIIEEVARKLPQEEKIKLAKAADLLKKENA